MAYGVRVTARATRDLALIFETIHAESSDAALRWYQGLQEAIISLEEQPNRCPKTPEDPRLRHLLYGYDHRVYRVIYRVTQKSKRVDVLHIRHGARRQFLSSDVI